MSTKQSSISVLRETEPQLCQNNDWQVGHICTVTIAATMVRIVWGKSTIDWYQVQDLFRSRAWIPSMPICGFINLFH